jgi:peptide/nickel transport system permease protein
VQRLKELYGLADKSFTGIMKSYSAWLKGTMSGDLGFHSCTANPLREVLSDYIWISFMIAFVSYILQILIGIPMGIKAAVNQYSAYDYTVSVFAMMGTALPSFFLSALLMNVFRY